MRSCSRQRGKLSRLSAPMTSPARKALQVVRADDQRELVLRFPRPQRVQRPDRIMRRFHPELYVIDPDPDLRMPLHGLHRRLIPFAPAERIRRVLERTLRRYDEVHPVKRRIPRQILHNGLMADMQRVERARINRNSHSARNASTIASASASAVARSSLMRTLSNWGA